MLERLFCIFCHFPTFLSLRAKPLFFLGNGLLEIESECLWGLKHFLLVIDAGHSAQISHVLPALCSYVISECTIGSGTIYTAY